MRFTRHTRGLPMRRLFLGAAIALCLAACANPEPTPGPTALPATTETPTVRPSSTPTVEPSVTPTRTSTPQPSATPSPRPSATPTATPPPLRVAIDPGHGGRDLGARHFDDEGHLDFCESEVNLAIALRLRELLLAEGFEVVMTRDDDYGLNPERKDLSGDGVVDHVDELQARLDLVNKTQADVLLSIHQNAFYWESGEPANDVGGTITFYCADRAFGEANLLLAALVHQEVLAAFAELGYDINDRGVEDDKELEVPGDGGKHLILLGPESDRSVRPSQMPGVLSETLFITHAKEAMLARDPAALDRLAEAYARAMIAFASPPCPTSQP